jgi:hypothetical protein
MTRTTRSRFARQYGEYVLRGGRCGSGAPNGTPIMHARHPAQIAGLDSRKLQRLAYVSHNCGGGWLGQAAR